MGLIAGVRAIAWSLVGIIIRFKDIKSKFDMMMREGCETFIKA